MKDLNWLADLASDCHAFGERHGLRQVELSALEILRAIERDFGLKIMILPRGGSHTSTNQSSWVEPASNVIRFPLRLHIPFQCSDIIDN